MNASRMGKIVFQFPYSEPKETCCLTGQRSDPAEGIGAEERLSLTLALSQRQREFRVVLSPPCRDIRPYVQKMYALIG